MLLTATFGCDTAEDELRKVHETTEELIRRVFKGVLLRQSPPDPHETSPLLNRGTLRVPAGVFSV